ncbi:MAG TPA: AAA family ATPase [Bacillota bacterium]|nr:AAA family ATPase [Bacillota bacterium]
MSDTISVVLATGDDLLRPVLSEASDISIVGLANQPDQVIELVDQLMPQVLVLADYMDPAMDAVKLLTHRFASTRIIYIITGEDETRIKESLIELGIFDFLPHTFRKSELYGLVREPRDWHQLVGAEILLEDYLTQPQPSTDIPSGGQPPESLSSPRFSYQDQRVVSPSLTAPALQPPSSSIPLTMNPSKQQDVSAGEGGMLSKMLGGISSVTKELLDKEKNGAKHAPEKSLPRITVVKQQIVAFWSAKPGVGKTFLAVNTAVALARSGVKVAILDGDIINLSVGVYLNLTDVKRTLERALKCSHVDELGECLLYHPEFPNLAILSGSEYCRPEGYCAIEKERVEKLIDYLKSRFDVIIIDTASDVQTVTTFTALQQATKLVMVTNQDYAQVFAAKKMLALLNRLRIPRDKLQLVLNGEVKGCRLTRGMVENMLECKMRQSLPHLPRQVLDSIFDSRPLVLMGTAETAEIRQAIEQLANEIFPVLFENKQSIFGGFSRILGKKGIISYG